MGDCIYPVWHNGSYGTGIDWIRNLWDKED